MSLEQFEIILDNPTSTYLPGQWVSGKIWVKAEGSEIKYKGLTITFKGHATFTVGNKREADMRLRGHEVYFNVTQKMFGNFDDPSRRKSSGEGNSGAIVFKPGKQTSFPFSFELPSNKKIPHSVEFPNGKVEYVLIAVLQRTSWKSDDETSKFIQVKAALPLRNNPKAAFPVESSETKKFCCLCCASGQLSLGVKLPKKGFVPGEMIPVKVEMDNKSGRKIRDFSAAICQTVEYKSNGGCCEKLNLYSEIARGKSLNKGESATWIAELVVPDLPPTRLGGCCKIIEVDYAISVWTAYNKLSSPLILFCPILIGTGEETPEKNGIEAKQQGGDNANKCKNK